MDRVRIGENFDRQPLWKVFIGVPLIYLPLLFSIPFVVICVWLVKAHLRLMGARQIRPFSDFVPGWDSHRYRYQNQIIYSTGAGWHNLRHYRWYWLFNCKLYCPLSVGLFRYVGYLVMVVENWWCPFGHDKKAEYQQGAIDKSYWHLHEQEQARLHPQDCVNPIWNEAYEQEQQAGRDAAPGRNAPARKTTTVKKNAALGIDAQAESK